MGGAHVQQSHTAVPGQGVHVLQVELLHNPFLQVLHQESRHIDRVLGGGVGRRVGQIQILELEGRQSGAQGGGQHVDPLIHPFVAHDLGP